MRTIEAYHGPCDSLIIKVTISSSNQTDTDNGLSLVDGDTLTPVSDIADIQHKIDEISTWSSSTPDGNMARVTIPVSPDEDFYGLGLQLLSHCQTGRLKRLKTNADPISDIGDSHYVSPFLTSTKGYALLVDTHGYAEFDICAAQPGKLILAVPGSSIVVYLISAQSMAKSIQASIIIQGRPALPPAWGLGLLYRAHLETTQETILNFAKSFRERKVPCDVIGLEPGWQTKAYPCSFVWNPDRFPSPKPMADELHKEGFRLNLWEHAWTSPQSPIADELRPYCADKGGMNGLTPDFTIDKAREIFQSQQAKLVDDGVDGFKLDECDGSDHTGGWFFPDDAKFPSGLAGKDMHNAFGFLYQSVMHDLYAGRNLRTSLLCRGNWATDKGQPTVAYSDLYALKDFVRGIVNSGYSGALWSPEVRDMHDPTDFVRRCQVMFFSHLPQVNAWYNGVAPWDLGEEVCAIFRKYDELRMSLLPYIYSAWRRFHEEGLPVIRGLAMEYPDDTAARDVDDEFMFGDAFLVAPIVDVTSNRRTVYLPKGQWYDYWTRASYVGPIHLSVEAPLETMPLYVKSGSIIPSGPVHQYTSLESFSDVTLEVWGMPAEDCPSESILYIDDLTSLDYMKGIYYRRSVSVTRTSKGMEVKLGEVDGSHTAGIIKKLQLRFIDISHAEVKDATRMLDTAEADERCFSYDFDSRKLSVRLAKSDVDSSKSMSFFIDWMDRGQASSTFLHSLTTIAKRLGKWGHILNGLAGETSLSLQEAWTTTLGSAVETYVKDASDTALTQFFPVTVRSSIKNDQIRPKLCKVVVDVENDRSNPEITVSLTVKVNQGWRVDGELPVVSLPGGHRRQMELTIVTTGNGIPANLQLSVGVDRTYRQRTWSESFTRTWGGYITEWSVDGQVVASEGNNALNHFSPGYTSVWSYVWSPVSCEAQLEVGSDTSVELYLNGNSLGKCQPQQSLSPAQQRFPFKLNTGWSKLTITLPGDGSSIYTRLAGQWGQTLDFVKLEPECNEDGGR